MNVAVEVSENKSLLPVKWYMGESYSTATLVDSLMNEGEGWVGEKRFKNVDVFGFTV